MAATTENFANRPSVLRPSLDAVSALFDSLKRACVAAEAYQNLSHMSDAQLAKRGLDRSSVADHVMTRYLRA